MTSAVVGLAISCLTVAIIIAQAGQGPTPGPGRRGPGFGGPGLFGLRIAELSDAQREQVRAVMERHEDETRPLWEQQRTARFALEDAILAGSIDEGTIRQKSAELGSVDAELAVVRARIHAEVMTLLTREQQQQLQEQRTRMRERRESAPSRGQPR
jgi:Spy/CpxP family protein refolding chaperone